jgi:colicin import membrane protein
MSRKEIDRAEKAERDRAEKVRKEKDKSDRKIRDKAEKDRKEKDKSDKKLQDKAEKDRKEKTKSDKKIQDRAEKVRKEKDKSDRKIQASERARKFEEVLGAETEKSKGCCEPCNYQARTSNGEYLPCKMGHKDSGPNKGTCADCSISRYHPKK